MDNETERQYIWRLHYFVEQGEISWKQLADYVNKEFREDEEHYRDESAYRKPCQGASAYYDEVFSKMISNEYSDNIAEQRRSLERAKIQFRDERNAWQKQNYADARVEQKLNYLEDVIVQNGKDKYVSCPLATVNSTDNSMVVCLSDLHIGATFDSIWGKYDSYIAKSRLETYLHNVIKIGKRHEITKVVVLGLGDILNNSIHKTIAITNRENVIEQIILASQLVSDFIYEITQCFAEVEFINVAGNHSRIDSKSDALKDERLDNLIGWYVSQSLKHIENFTYQPCLDTTLGMIYVNKLPYYICHGDYDAFGKSGLTNLILATGVKPTGVFFGHYHTCAMEDVADVKLIRSGSLCGSGCDYTIEKRLTGKPSQMIAICNNDGVECVYPVVLD